MTDQNKTLIAALLDRSGSMVSSVQATQDGFNELIKGQKEEPGECSVTLAQFDSVYEHVYHNTPIAEVPKLELVPRGSTALLDGIGKLVVETGEELAKLSEDQRPGQVIVVIMTDGGENASREWRWDSIKNLVKQQEDQYGWQFLFLGANIDAVGVAGDLGIGAERAIQFDSHDYTNNAAVYASTSNVVSGLRSADVKVRAAAKFTDEDRDAAMGRVKATSK